MEDLKDLRIAKAYVMRALGVSPKQAGESRLPSCAMRFPYAAQVTAE
jgi:hypothetical protein